MANHLAIIMAYLSVSLFVLASIGIGIYLVEGLFWCFCCLFCMVDNQIQKLPMKIEHKNNKNTDFVFKKVA